MPKTIAIFTDGTGNAARSLFKTNVWRLYQALDLGQVRAEQPQSAQLQQVAYYQDGIGTSTFKPLAVIGGAFGWGLKRNVIDAYIHLCETYQLGDDIFLFGFSRGGFTARVLLGLIRSQGLLTCRHKAELHRYAPDAYRRYRSGFKNANYLVSCLRKIRDGVIAQWRCTFNQPHYRAVMRKNVRTRIKFIGVWDTVSAYGLPIAELTRGIDRWIWPLSLPNARLPLGVDLARHALALDDERAAFHPLLWNETDSEDPDRILQVWFSGMHADVGGGYPHDGLALFPLTWMMRQAASAGLRFRPGVIEDAEAALSHSVPMHDSRGFLGAYYRYQPRRTSDYIQEPEVHALTMRGTAPGALGPIRQVNVHESVLERVRSGPDRYAPIALTTDFVVRGRDENAVDQSRLRAGQEAVWDLVWWRRVAYFTSLIVTVVLIFYPFFFEVDEACEYPLCALVPAVSGLANLLPAALRQWARGFGSAPELLFVLLVILSCLLQWSRHLQRRIHDTMRDLWDRTLDIAASQTVGNALAAERASSRNPFTRLFATILRRTIAGSSRLRRNQNYQGFWRLIRCVAPDAFGWGLLLTSFALIALVGQLACLRFQIGYRDATGSFCQKMSDPSFLTGSMLLAGEFSTNSLCWPTGVLVRRANNYRVIFDVLEPWEKVGDIYTNPTGVERTRVGWFRTFQEALRRRSITARLFQPLVRISSMGRGEIQALDVQQVTEHRFVGTFSANRDGELFIFVNDMVISRLAITTGYYRTNKGTARITIEGP